MVLIAGALPATRRTGAFTLAEVVIALAILAFAVQGVIFGYIGAAQRAEWSAHSLAAQSFALQQVEQARAAHWDPQIVSTNGGDDLPPGNYIYTNALDIPVIAGGKPVYATNFLSIAVVSTMPPLRQIRVDCIWPFYKRGPFTNTVITLRAPDQ